MGCNWLYRNPVPSARYRIIDQEQLMAYTQTQPLNELGNLHRNWHTEQDTEKLDWSGNIAIGSKEFVTGVKQRLGIGMKYRKLDDCGQYFTQKKI